MGVDETIDNSDLSLKNKENVKKNNGVEKKLQTNWFAIAGSVSSGKTTLVKKLADYYGFRTVTDHARAVISEALQSGLSHDEFLQNRQFHQDKIAERFVNDCCGLDREEPAIHDYGLPCVHAFYTANSLNLNNQLKNACETFRYKRVFLVSPLDMIDDDVRITTDFQRAIYYEVVEAYKEFGYQVIHVPTFYRDRTKSINARFEFIKDQINRSLLEKKPIVQDNKEKVFA